MAATARPVIGKDVVVSEGRPIPVQCIPVEIGLRRQAVEYTCADASQQFLAVGSAQGYVWVVDLQSSRLLREFSEFKGSAVTVVKLNPVRDYIAYGTERGFIRIERLSKVKFTKLRVQERSGQNVNCIEWSQNGEDIFCGFESGRVVHFHVKFKSDVMKHVPLYPEQCGSPVVQLSFSEGLLLVSTLDRTFLLDVNTNKLDQVGRKERKSGVYGGCFVENGESLLVARPGLRIWIADKFGKVLNTMAFKEVLSSQHIPSVVISSVPTCPPQFSRSWQFSTLHPILGGKFIVTCQENTIFILDPRNGAIVGVTTFQNCVKSVVSSGGFLYVLTNRLVRVAVHHSHVTMEYEQKKVLSSASTPCTSVGNSPSGSLENLDAVELSDGSSLLMCSKQSSLSQVLEQAGQVEQASIGEEDEVSAEALEQAGYLERASNLEQASRNPTQTVDLGQDLELKDVGDLQKVRGLGQAAGVGDLLPPALVVSEVCSFDMAHQHSEATQTSEVYEGEIRDETELVSHQSADQLHFKLRMEGLKLELLKLTPRKLPGVVSSPPKSPDKSQAEEVLKEECSGEKELARRLRMAQAAEENIIADNKAHRRKRKRTKGKKISSAASSTSVSMERLADIEEQVDEQLKREEQEDQQVVPKEQDDQQVVPKEQDDQQIMPEEQEDHKLTPEEQEDQQIMPEDQQIMPEDQQIKPEEHEDHQVTPEEQEDQQMMPEEQEDQQVMFEEENEEELLATQQLISSDQHEQSSEFLANANTVVSVQTPNLLKDFEAGLEKKSIALEDFIENVGSNDDASANFISAQLIDHESGQQFPSEIFESKLEFVEAISASPPGELISETWSVTIPPAATNDKEKESTVGDEPTGFSVVIKEKSDVTVEDESDDPLYQDTFQGRRKKPIPLFAVSQHSVLQPALSNPLQDEEMLETGTASDMSRQIPHPELFTAATGLFPSVSTKKPSRETSWIDISEKDSCYSREQNFDMSDSSQDSEVEITAEVSVTESQVADDFYQLCGALVKTTDELPTTSNNLFSHASVSDSNSLSQASQLCEVQESEINVNEKVSEEQSMDIWSSVSLPSRHGLQCVCISDELIWAVDTRNQVFYTTTSDRGQNWQRIKKAMQQVSSSPSGRIVWSVYHQNAYVRLGIGMNAAGSTWQNVTKNTSLAHKIKQLAVDENAIWAVAVDNRVLFRKGVDERNPEGKVWQEVSYGLNLTSVACSNRTAWALDQNGKVFVRDGITPATPSGKKWLEIKSPSMMTVCITTDGIVWGINEEGSVGFRTGITPSKPGGRGPWWEVVVSSDSPAISPLNSLWQAMGADGSHLLSSAVSSLVSLPHHHQPVSAVSASSKAGVLVLESGHKLYGCWRKATGYHYTPACKEGVFQFNAWSHIAAGGTSLWFVRSDGDLYCLSHSSKLKRVEVPSTVELIAASPNCMWVISKDMVWSRQGMTIDYPEGISFDYIELSTLLHDKKLRSVACGKKVAWGIDSSGVPHFRFGVHAREPGTGMSPAWVPVEDHPGPLLQIAVCSDDWLVWACDEEHNVYVRGGVTVDFPVGKNWIRIPKQKMRELAATCDRMYGLSPNGELFCRYGINETNVLGNFWRRMPGKYKHITTGMFGELWTLDSKGQVWKQDWKVITVSDMHTDFDPNVTCNSEAWEFI